MMRAAWRPTLAATALAFLAPGAGALELGEAEVRTRSGEPLEARIPVIAEAGEAFRGACFSIARDPSRSLPVPATLELRRRAGGANLFLRTHAPVASSPLAFAIAVGCPGTQPTARPYSVALAAMPAQAAAPGPAASAPPAFPPLPTIASLVADAGDTLASIARRIFPIEPRARAAYLEAIRASNPALAAKADDEPLDAGTPIALPDLHAFAESGRAARTRLAAQKAPAERRAQHPAAPKVAAAALSEPPPKPAPAPKPASPRKAAAPKAAPKSGKNAVAATPSAVPDARRAAHESPPPPAARAVPAGFQLKLSGPTVDLSPSQAIDEGRRAELRERLLVLEADDRTAEMLSMREAIRKLESRVTELQLKLAHMPATPVAQPTPAAPAPAVPAPVVAPPKEVVAAPKEVVAPQEAAAPVKASPPTPQAEAPAPPQPIAKEAAPPSEQDAATATPVPRPKVIPRAAPENPWYESPWWLPALLGLAALLIAISLIRRRRAGYGEVAGFSEEPADDGTQVIEAPVEEGPATEPPVDPHAQTLVIPQPLIASRVPSEDTAELRRRYMEERFPEIVNGALVLDDPDSVVKAARLLYEDGAAPRAIELLQFAIEQEPRQKAPWLALFEIFRRERLAGEFGRLARRFGEVHAASREWRKVLRVGRDLEPGNPVYQGDAAASFDPAAENWLQSEGDGAGAPLAGELRGALMADASVTEGDLKADPIPALRKSESFDVA